MNHEEIVERRERSLHRMSDRLARVGPRARKLALRVAPVAAAVGLAIAAVAARSAIDTPQFAVSPAPTIDVGITPTPSESPSPSELPTPVAMTAIDGAGPMVLFARRASQEGETPERWRIFLARPAFDDPDTFPEPEFVVEVEGSIRGLYPPSLQSSGKAVVAVAGTTDTQPRAFDGLGVPARRRAGAARRRPGRFSDGRDRGSQGRHARRHAPQLVGQRRVDFDVSCRRRQRRNVRRERAGAAWRNRSSVPGFVARR